MYGYASAVAEAGLIITDISRRGGGGGGGEYKASKRKKAKGAKAAAKKGRREKRASRRRGGGTGSSSGGGGFGSDGGGGFSSGGDGGGGGDEGSVPIANAAACAYILFDTRMDIPQARAGAELLELQRTTAVAHFPEELFMLMRVVTIIRGLLGSMHVDVSAARVWEPWARYALGLLPGAPDEDVDNVMAGGCTS